MLSDTYIQFVMPVPEEWKSKVVCFEFQAVSIVVISRVAETELAVTLIPAVRDHVVLV